MTVQRKNVLTFSFLLVLSVVITLNDAFADRLIFQSGNSVEGVVLEESADQVVFRDTSGQIRTYNKTVLRYVIREEAALGSSVAEIIERANALRNTGNFPAALSLFQQAVQQTPHTAPALAEAYQALLFQLDTAARDALSRDKRSARELYRICYDALQTSAATLLVPSSETRQSWLRTTRQTLARISFDIAREMWPPQPGQLSMIRELLQEAVDLDPTNTDAHLFLGNVALSTGAWDLAAREYRIVLGTSGIPEDRRRQAQEGLQIAEARRIQLAAQPAASQAVAASRAEPTAPPFQEQSSARRAPPWLNKIVARLDQMGLMRHIRPVWQELASGEYNAYLIGVPLFIFGFWLIPYWIVRYRSRKGDMIAGELRERTKKLGLIGLGLYIARLTKQSKPKNRCPFCNKSLDKLEAYSELNFSVCPHCHEPITPIYDLKDYIQHLIRQLETQLRHSKENLIPGGERDLMLKLVRAVITLAVRKRASDLHIESELDGAKLRVRVDGMMYDFLRLPKSVGNAFISALKIMANLDIVERRVPQDGKIGMWIDRTDLDLRINTSPAALGEKVTLRILNLKSLSLEPAKLGLDGENLERFERAIHKPSGMIIITGPAGSGKSTTLYTALSILNTGQKNIVTLEDPVEYQIPGASQMQVNPATNFTFASGLRSILRQDPDIIMVGEIRDSETAAIAVDAALTGHLLFTTLHTIDAATAFARLAELGVETSRVASALICIIAQRLVRVICGHCMKTYRPKSEVLDQLNVVEVPPGFTFVHGTGCEECMNTGYRGRIGLFEFLMPDDRMREVLEGAPPVSVIRELARKRGFATLREEGLRRVWAGVTTVEEVLRVTS